MEDDIGGIVLGGDEIIFGDKNAQSNSLNEDSKLNELNEENKNGADSGKAAKATIEEFYESMVSGFENSRGSDYRLYLLQGNVSASVVYGIVGLGMFATPTEEESERIAKWCGEWQKEAEKFIRVDVSKSEITAECAAVLKSLFTNRYMNEELNESLKNISFGQLDLIIRSKCSDRIVELDEMLEIMENAARLGFLESTDRKTFIEKIKGEIFTLGAKIDTVQSAFVRYFNDRKNIDPVNAVNSEKNRLILAKKCMEFSVVSAKIYGEEANNDEKFYIENLPSFLEECSLKLDSPVESFKINYFAQFKNSHNISEPLPASDFSELQAGAIMYGLSQDDWKFFLDENSIFLEVIDDRQAEIDALNAKIAELEKMQNAMNAASKQATTSTTNSADSKTAINSNSANSINSTNLENSTNSVNSSNLIEEKSQNEEIIRMVEVQGGSFMREGFEITLSNFKISETPVTQELYEKIVRRNPSNFKGEKLPVEQVSWLDAIKFCNLLSRKEGLKLCYKKDFLGAIVCDFTADGYRLPTEAEWEFAARGGEAGLGFRFSGSNNLNEAGWYCVNSKEKTREVKKRKANELGLFDMSGNVWEWCNDFFAPYPAKPLKNPRGQPTGDIRVARGGSWNSTAEECTLTFRKSFSPAEINSAIGFRIVRSV